MNFIFAYIRMKITFNIFSVRLREGCIKDIYKNVNIKDINTIPGSSHIYLFPPVLFQVHFSFPFIYRTKKKKKECDTQC